MRRLMVLLLVVSLLYPLTRFHFPHIRTVPAQFKPDLVCVLVASTSRTRSNALVTYSVPSLKRTTEPRFLYSLWVGVDAGDAMDPEVDRLAHPIQVHWVSVDNPTEKPGPVFNHISNAAVQYGCDYTYRINDDTELTGLWTSAFVDTLQGFSPPNVGVVGPTCHEGNTAILTHDFVHRTHHTIFGYRYPPSLTDWWLDDWISNVYGVGRTRKLEGVVVKHHLQPTSYEVTFSNHMHLQSELEAGQRLLRDYLGENNSVAITQRPSDARENLTSTGGFQTTSARSNHSLEAHKRPSDARENLTSTGGFQTTLATWMQTSSARSNHSLETHRISEARPSDARENSSKWPT